MYISYHVLETIHKDTVDDGLRRSERRRMLKELERETDTRTRVRNVPAAVSGLVRSILGAVARPQRFPRPRKA
jgi:hypothetical protein